MKKPIKTIRIHDKDYVPVEERVRMAHEDNPDQLTIMTDFLPHDMLILCKATVTTKKGTFTGTSAADITKLIEKKSPYEVSETSAIGRALGFAGYGIADGIASAEEIEKATESELPAPATSEAEEPLVTMIQLRTIKGMLDPGVYQEKKSVIDKLSKRAAEKYIIELSKRSGSKPATTDDIDQAFPIEEPA
jgi:hypothetical protein